MPQAPLRKSHRGIGRPPFETVALVLQGGGALGAYQPGVYQALAEADVLPDWVAGISIGAINAAIIAGNPPETRVEKLKLFWESITAILPWDALVDAWSSVVSLGEAARTARNQFSSMMALAQGAAGFFEPRRLLPYLLPPGAPGATSFYDTSLLQATLEKLVDFDRINNGPLRLSLGTVNVRTGNFVYFDSTTHTIGPKHVMASGALPPGFPAVEIDGEFYWDGGLVSNTPLSWVMNDRPGRDTLAFQVDLWCARGPLPRDLGEVLMRQKEIQYSSRTRTNTDMSRDLQAMRNALGELLELLPPELRQTPQARLLAEAACHKVYRIVHLIYGSKTYEGQSKDYEFSRLSMEEHWRAGYEDAIRTLRRREALQRPEAVEGVATFDINRET